MPSSFGRRKNSGSLIVVELPGDNMAARFTYDIYKRLMENFRFTS